jgi:Fe-S oxidoreductase
MHVFIFYGALTFDTMTINHTLEGFLPDFFIFGRTNFALFFSLIVDVFAILVLGGVVFFIIKRFILRPKAYRTTPLDSFLIYVFLILVTLSYVYFEVFAILHHPGTERLSFLGNFLAQGIGNIGLSPAAVTSHFRIAWWLHIIFVFAFIAYVPHSKYLHLITGSLNVLFRSHSASGELKPLDIENSERYGIEKAADLHWKDCLDALACMECGRCQDACPAFASEKPLSPKMIIFNLENHLLRNGKTLIRRKPEDLAPLMPGVLSEGEVWTCTTCGACRHVCPVEIEHIPKIVGLRQNQVLMKSQFPSELNAFFKNMEVNSNPWGIGFAKRGDWAEGLPVKVFSSQPQAEYLFWVGCAGSFDEEGKKIARAMVEILNKAKVDFAILGVEEKCCGDSARRLGNEYLYQMLAAENIRLFAQYKISKIITICPHGFNTFKNEYPRLAGILASLSNEEKDHLARLEVFHHAEFIAKLLEHEMLPIEPQGVPSITYHDSCYLGRHNKIIEEPRQILKKVSSGEIVELKNSREHSFCCGAGGGLMWTEESLGKRINHLRAEEIIGSKVPVTATSCPFCLTMLRDAFKDKEKEDLQVKDIAQLVAEALVRS